MNFGPLASHVRGVAVDLQDDVVGLLLDEGVHTAAGDPKAHPSLLVGEGHVEKGDIRVEGVAAPLVHLAQVDGGVVRPARLQGPALLIAHKIGADAEGVGVGAVQEGHGGDDVGAADGHLRQVLGPGGDGVGHRPGVAGAAADVYVLAGPDQGGGVGHRDGLGPELGLQVGAHGASLLCVCSLSAGNRPHYTTRGRDAPGGRGHRDKICRK